MRNLQFPLALSLSVALGGATMLAPAQSPPSNGMRPVDLRTHAIVNAKVVVSPGVTLEKATIVIRNGIISEVGENVVAPSDAQIFSGEGMTIYPGLIDAALMSKSGKFEATPGSHWNERLRPEIEMSSEPAPEADLRKTMRAMGFTAAAVYPDSGILRGTGTVLALAEEEEHVLSYLDRTAMAASMDRVRGFGRRMYPNSLMGSISVIRQTLLDAQWHAASRRVWDNHPENNEPPIRADALDALALVINRYQPILFDVSDELNALRAAKIVTEFNLNAIILGSGLEFRRLDEIAEMKLPFIVPLNYPKTPDVATLTAAENATLRDLMTWEQAPTNPKRLLDAGVSISLTTHRLEKRSDFHKNLRNAIKHGLSEDEALAALTTTPAQLLGLEHVLGTIEVGKAANLVVVEGNLFEKDSKIRDTWINGRRHEISSAPEISLEGTFAFWTNRGFFYTATLNTEKSTLKIKIDEETTLKAEKVTINKDQVTFMLEAKPFKAEGYVLFSGVITDNGITGNGLMPDGDRFQFTFEPDDEAIAMNDDEDEDEEEAKEDDPNEIIGGLPPTELTLPLGAYGVLHPPKAQNVYIRNATIWTEGPMGIIENGCMIVENGRIAYVGVEPPDGPAEGVLVIDAQGKHLSPGLLDCHSHTGISGGVNEGSQAVTAEVRIGDVINPDDINFYRQLAGGLTACNQLHGSANPIGGQNSVIKLKWGGTVDDMRITDAISGIKFALGENPKRSEGRYPDTRMGVENIIRDAFTAAQDYKEKWDRFLSLPTEERELAMPPQRDLELDAMVEILQGERLIHCHSYRQDEILMLIRVADDFGFTIGTFQHVLEGYKIAEAIAKHGAGASSFSDWWAYKVEVMDAIPYNGALMTNVGVTVSFNSDSSELARRMNTEAAKAVRYGGLDPHEALKLVTLNPAKQLRVDHRIGSLEVGKDADFVIWSDSPLSTYARCEQTWIEGARYFDLRIDKMLRDQTRSERQRIIQKILAQSKKGKGKDDESKGEEGGPRRRGRRPQMLTLLQQDWLEQIRLGNDPMEMKPGECEDTEAVLELMQSQGGAR